MTDEVAKDKESLITSSQFSGSISTSYSQGQKDSIELILRIFFLSKCNVLLVISLSTSLKTTPFDYYHIRTNKV